MSSIQCLSDETIQRFVEGGLPAEREDEARHHLDRCAECRVLIADLVRDGSVSAASVASTGLGLPAGAVSVQTGDLLSDRYRVEGLLGYGGMAYVVRARDEKTAGLVAIKLLRAELTLSPSATARFIREAQVAASIQSAYCVRVFEVAALPSGAPYIVMEHLVGRPLSGVLAQRACISVSDTATWISDACDAVGEAHERGIVHRDLKLQNLFLAHDAESSGPLVKVLDFGLAKHTRMAGITVPEELLGTPHYMAPEQIRDPRSVGPAADIWSLGACLYRLLTGAHPFPGLQRTAVCASILKDPLAPVGKLREDMPEAFADLVESCLAKDPAKRPESARALATALDAWR